MKLFIVGSDKVYAIENFYVKYLREAGVDVFHFPAQSYFYDFYHWNVSHKIIFKLGLSGIFKQINNRLKEEATRFAPDVIWVFKGMEILPATLQWAKKRGIKLVNFNGDNPFLFSGKGSGNKNVSRSIRFFDLHLTYNTEVQKEMEETWQILTGILPFGFNIEDALFEKCCQQTEIVKACFLGNPDNYRGTFLQELAGRGVQIDLYGNNWDRFVSHPNIQVFQPVYGDDFWLTLRRYRLQLNIMRPHNPNTHNMRSFEIPGVGGIQLAPATNDHQLYFEPGVDIYLYQDLDDCVSAAKKILALPQNEADAIRQNARDRSLRCGYSYRDRATQALRQIEHILG